MFSISPPDAVGIPVEFWIICGADVPDPPPNPPPQVIIDPNVVEFALPPGPFTPPAS